jgi:outer membrane lipoprotein-sorting protein
MLRHTYETTQELIPCCANRRRSLFSSSSYLRNWSLLFLGFCLLNPPVALVAADTNAIVAAWLGAQTNIQTWSADFVQTRTFKSLTQPLMATGQVFFAAPNRFHWELGRPAQTIAVRAPEEMLVFYPKLKRVERYPLTGDQMGPWQDALALLEAGFPRSKAEMEARLKIVSQTGTDDSCELVLQPKSAAARKMMPQIKIVFGTQDFMLRATELEFADGSTMRNDFSNAKLNPKVDHSMFSPRIPSDYKIIEPLKQPGSGKGPARRQ